MAGPASVAQGITGLVAGHMWWWAVWGQQRPPAWAKAPVFLRSVVGDGPGVIGGTGVHVVPPRQTRSGGGGTASVTGHRWGSGNRLGDS